MRELTLEEIGQYLSAVAQSLTLTQKRELGRAVLENLRTKPVGKLGRTN